VKKLKTCTLSISVESILEHHLLLGIVIIKNPNLAVHVIKVFILTNNLIGLNNNTFSIFYQHLKSK